MMSMSRDESPPDIAQLSISEAPSPAIQSSQRPQAKLGSYWNKREPQDITLQFTKASSELQLGQLIKDEAFTLFESVGALEIMDPKMDSGLSVPAEDDAMEQFDPMSHVLPEEIIGLMDQMLCYDMAWHEGYPLSQTLFTSLHLNNILSSESKPLARLLFRTSRNDKAEPGYSLITKILRAYCLGIAKCCDIVIRQIISEHYYEEEDFVTQTFTRDLLTTTNALDILHLLEDAKATVAKLQIPTNMRIAILDRLDLRQALLEAYCRTRLGPAADDREHWESVLSRLKPLESSHNLGKLVPDAFSVRVQRFLASNTPPRPAIEVTWTEAFTKLKRMCEDNVNAYKLCEIADTPRPQAFLRFAWDFTSRKPQPNTYSRALIQGLLFNGGNVTGPDESGIPHVDLLVTDLRELVMSGDTLFDPINWEIELPSDPRFQMARKVDEFLAKATEEYLNLYRMTCQNRCRIRRTYAQSVAILDTLQAMAEDLDADVLSIRLAAGPKLIRPEPAQFYPFSAWIYTHKLRVMEHVVQLGFELDVYLPDELATMYATLAQFSNTRAEHLQHLAYIFASRHAQLASTSPIPAVECASSHTFITILSTQSSATMHLADALSHIFTVLNILHLLPSPERPYSNPALRHELRMKPFLPVGTPHIPTHAELDAVTNPPAETPISSMLVVAETSLKDAKRELQILKTSKPEEGRFEGVEEGWKKEVQGLLLSCIAAGLAVAALKGVCQKSGLDTVGHVEGKLKEVGDMFNVFLPQSEDRYAIWWIVPKVVVKP